MPSRKQGERVWKSGRKASPTTESGMLPTTSTIVITFVRTQFTPVFAGVPPITPTALHMAATNSTNSLSG